MSTGIQEVVPIDTTDTTPPEHRAARALRAENPSIRLRAAMAAGSSTDPALLEPLVQRCAVEPDFFVRDMLSWALTRLPPETVLPRIRRELGSARNQARSQALHTLSKIGDRSTWGWITRDMLRDPDDEVARTAWRAAVVLVPADEEENLAGELVRRLGRGDRSVQLSLSRALVDLGDVVDPLLAQAVRDPDPAVAAHARATELLREDPETGFDAAVEEARRVVNLGPELAATATGAARSQATETARGEARETAQGEARETAQGEATETAQGEATETTRGEATEAAQAGNGEAADC